MQQARTGYQRMVSGARWLNDTIDGLGGNDLLCGNAGNDTLVGGTGDDTLVGDAGTDVCDGGTHVSGDTASGCEYVTGVP